MKEDDDVESQESGITKCGKGEGEFQETWQQ